MGRKLISKKRVKIRKYTVIFWEDTKAKGKKPFSIKQIYF